MNIWWVDSNLAGKKSKADNVLLYVTGKNVNVKTIGKSFILIPWCKNWMYKHCILQNVSSHICISYKCEKKIISQNLFVLNSFGLQDRY